MVKLLWYWLQTLKPSDGGHVVRLFTLGVDHEPHCQTVAVRCDDSHRLVVLSWHELTECAHYVYDTGCRARIGVNDANVCLSCNITDN